MKKLLLLLVAFVTIHNSYAQCVAGFSSTSAPSNNNLLNVAFTNTSTPTSFPPNTYATWTMIWGDATPSGWLSPTGTTNHNYVSPGTYSPTLVMTVYDSLTSAIICSDSETHPITVAYTPCGTAFTTSQSGAVVTVTATNPAGTSGMTYTWNWGDGSPASTGSSAVHTYATSGVKTITLTATNGSCTYTNTRTVTITVPPSSCSSLIANFSWTATGTNVNFSNTSTFFSGTTRTSQWNFGDATTSTSFSTSHTYASAGTYTVTLITTWTDSGSVVYCRDTVVKSVTVTAPVNVIRGYIYQDSLTGISSPQYKVWLIVFDSVTNTLSAVDSVTVTGSGSGYATLYEFYGKAAGVYRTKAKLLNGPTSGFGALPTYHLSSLMWNSASIINHTGGTTQYKSIVLQYGTVTSGPGFIAGNVSAGANKGTSSGIPGMTILLMASNGNPVASVTTDANGDYSFTNLAPATYVVYPEEWGFNTTTASVVVLNNDPTHNNINFVRSARAQTITPASTSIRNIPNNAAFAVYPNPAKNTVTVELENNVKASIAVTDITGKVVVTATATGKTILRLDQLQKGLYFVTVEAENNKQTQKLLLQ